MHRSMFASESIPPTTPAAILEGPGQLVVREIPNWDITAYGDEDLVLVRIEAVGVCGSDFRYFLGENPWAQHTLGRFVPNPPNIVLGHEYAGTVVQVQTDRNRALLGQRVAPVCSKVCGCCPDCRAGRSRLCADTVHMGHGQGWGDRDFYPGAYARYALAWGASCFPVPESVTVKEAAMMDILAVCVHVADQGAIQPGRPVLCIGAGPAGNGVGQAALALGASRVVFIEPSEEARKRSSRIGLTLAEPYLDSLRSVAPDGFGTVFDTVGTGATLNIGLDLLGKAGTLVNLAVHDGEFPLNWMRLGSERRLVTSCNFEVGDYPRGLAWLEAGRFNVKDWMTETTLEDLPEHFHRITSSDGPKDVFKLIVNPWA